MNAQMFIDSIKQVVIEDSIKSVQTNLDNPPGKKPVYELVQLSEWFKSFDFENQDMILKLVRESVQTSVFGFLCVLDGVRAIEDNEIKGRLKLIYEKGHESILLNDLNKDYLHDLL
ncbi:MAG TPA: hypothetical protein V6C58_11600 [Allocoleopsis sp.]